MAKAKKPAGKPAKKKQTAKVTPPPVETPGEGATEIREGDETPIEYGKVTKKFIVADDE